MSFTIREFTTDDYEVVVAIHNAVYPEYPETVDNYRRQEGLKREEIKWQRYLAVSEGRVVGVAEYSHSGFCFHPRKLDVEVQVHPEFRRRGIGSTLYEKVIAEAAALEPLALKSMVCEGNEAACKFARDRGFADQMREQESLLEFADFDPAAHGADLERMAEQGIELIDYPELQSRFVDHERLYFDVRQTVARDMPATDPYTPDPFEIWRERSLLSPHFLPELHFIALCDEELVGVSNFAHCELEGRLETGLTGVRREYRKRGIASALKVAAVTRAKELGYKNTITWNEENNTGMLGINLRLGFKFRPAWIMNEKVLDEKGLQEFDAKAAGGGS